MVKIARETTLIKFTVPTSLLEELQAEALKANLPFGPYMITILNSRGQHSQPNKVDAPPPSPPVDRPLKELKELAPERRAREKKEEQERKHNEVKSSFVQMLTTGDEDGRIWEASELGADIANIADKTKRQFMDNALIEAMKETGLYKKINAPIVYRPDSPKSVWDEATKTWIKKPRPTPDEIIASFGWDEE